MRIARSPVVETLSDDPPGTARPWNFRGAATVLAVSLVAAFGLRAGARSAPAARARCRSPHAPAPLGRLRTTGTGTAARTSDRGLDRDPLAERAVPDAAAGRAAVDAQDIESAAPAKSVSAAPAKSDRGGAAPAKTRRRGPIAVARQAVSGWIDDGGPQQGAAIAYYTIFAIAPLMLIVLAIAGLVFGDDAASGRVFEEVGGLVGSDAAQAIQSMLASTRDDAGHGIVGAAISVITALIGASAVFVALKAAFDAVFHPQAAADTRSAVTAFMRARLVSIALVIGLGFLVVVTLLLSTAVAAFGTWLGGAVPALEPVLALLDVVLSTVVLTIAFALMIRLLPQRAPRMRAVWAGAFASAVLFAIGKHLIGLYLAHGAVASAFGAAGSLIVVVVWVYYSTQILLLGAEVARALDDPAASASANGQRAAGDISARARVAPTPR